MALETLKDVTHIDGCPVAQLQEFADKRPAEHIVVNHKNNGISFRIQRGPIKEVGENGCQVTALIAAARIIIRELNNKFPCGENEETINCLDQALRSQELRTYGRTARGVEGKNEL